jgi:O-antigen ligase
VTAALARPLPGTLLAVLLGWAAFLPIGGKYTAYVGCAAAALWTLSRDGRLRALLDDPGFRAAAAFHAFTVLSVLWSSGQPGDIAAQVGLYSLLPMAPLIALACPADLAGRAVRQFAIAAAVIGSAVVLHRAGVLPTGILWHSTVEAEGNQRIVTSLVLALGAAVALSEALRAEAWRGASLGWSAAMVLAVAGLALQDRRTGMVALPVLLAVIGLVRERRWSRRIVAVATVAALSLAAWAFSPVVRDRIDEGLHEIRTYQSTDAAATSWGMRLRLAEHTWDMVRERPLAGHGVGSWQVQWRERVQPGLQISIHTTPHNEYLLVAAQLGAVGLLLLGGLLATQVVRSAWAGDAGLAALAAWTAIAWTGLFNVVLRDAKFALPLLLVAALAGAAHRAPMPAGRERRSPRPALDAVS